MPKSRGDTLEVVALLPSLSWSWSWSAWSGEFCEVILSHPVFEEVDLVPAKKRLILAQLFFSNKLLLKSAINLNEMLKTIVCFSIVKSSYQPVT